MSSCDSVSDGEIYDGPENSEDFDDFDEFNEGNFVNTDDLPKNPTPPIEEKVDPKFQKLADQFSEGGSSAATRRIIQDLRSLSEDNMKKFGYQVEVAENNLYRWLVRLVDFPDDCKLYEDLKKYSKKHGLDYIELEVLYPKNYPFEPPFIRVLQPRFQFMTGHITIGGSVCMELLTPSGWSSAYSLESILMQIKAEIIDGGARLDFSNRYPYGEAEARDAFRRMSAKYGWS